MAAFVVFAGVACVFAVAFLALLLKLAIRIILFPLFLLKLIVTGVVMLVVGPVLAVVGFALALVVALLLAVPLLPLLALGAIVWLLVRPPRPSVA